MADNTLPANQWPILHEVMTKTWQVLNGNTPMPPTFPQEVIDNMSDNIRILYFDLLKLYDQALYIINSEGMPYWGKILGKLENQTDLKDALNLLHQFTETETNAIKSSINDINNQIDEINNETSTLNAKKANKHKIQETSQTIDFPDTLIPIDGSIIGSQVITANTTEEGEVYFDKDKTPSQVKEEIKNTYDPLIPKQASPENQLATTDFVNSSIQHIAANRVTYTINGEPFPTRQSLISANTFFHNGIEYTPTIHDYCIVLADEDAPQPWTGGQTRMEFSGNQWEFAYGVNSEPHTAEENAAIQSGITAAHVEKIDNPDTQPTLDSEAFVTSGGVWSWFGAALSLLKTSAKTVVGAINELFENKAGLSGANFSGSISLQGDTRNIVPIVSTYQNRVPPVGALFPLKLTTTNQSVIDDTVVGKDITPCWQTNSSNMQPWENMHNWSGLLHGSNLTGNAQTLSGTYTIISRYSVGSGIYILWILRVA